MAAFDVAPHLPPFADHGAVFDQSFLHNPLVHHQPSAFARSLNSRHIQDQELERIQNIDLKRTPANVFHHPPIDHHDPGVLKSPELFHTSPSMFPGVFLPSELQGPLATVNGTSGTTIIKPRLSMPTLHNNTVMQLPVSIF